MQTAEHVRMFEVKFLGPTNTRGARVVVKDTRRRPEVRVYLPYDYALGDILKQAEQFLGLFDKVAGERQFAARADV